MAARGLRLQWEVQARPARVTDESDYMKNLTIRRRIMASFAVVLALMVLMAAVAYTRLTTIERQATNEPRAGRALQVYSKLRGLSGHRSRPPSASSIGNLSDLFPSTILQD